MDAFDAIAVVVVFIPIVDWLAFWLLSRARRRAIVEDGYVPVRLSERRAAAAFIACAATLGAFLGLTRLSHGPLPTEAFLLVLTAILLLPSMANLNWLVRALRGEFRGEP